MNAIWSESGEKRGRSMVTSGTASASTSFVSFTPAGFTTQRARSRMNVARLVEDHDMDVAFFRSNCSAPLWASIAKVSDPRVNVTFFPSGVHEGKDSGSGVRVTCRRPPVDIL